MLEVYPKKFENEHLYVVQMYTGTDPLRPRRAGVWRKAATP